MTEQFRGKGLEAPVPHFLYDTRGWRQADAVDFGREVVRRTYDLGLSRDRADHWFHTDIWFVGPLLFAANAGDGHTLLREARHLASNPGNYLKLQIFEQPGGVLFGPDASEPLEPRAVHLIDQSRPYRQQMAAGRNRTVFIPHSLLEYRPGAPAYIRLAAEKRRWRLPGPQHGGALRAVAQPDGRRRGRRCRGICRPREGAA